MSIENPLWGAPRIHGELLKLGFAVAQSSVAKYMVKRRGPRSQGWRTFLHNHAPEHLAQSRHELVRCTRLPSGLKRMGEPTREVWYHVVASQTVAVDRRDPEIICG